MNIKKVYLQAKIAGLDAFLVYDDCYDNRALVIIYEQVIYSIRWTGELSGRYPDPQSFEFSFYAGIIGKEKRGMEFFYEPKEVIDYFINKII